MSDSFKSAETSQPQGLTSSHVERLSETTNGDIPHASPPAKLESHWQRYYGFGRHFFTYALAEPLYRTALPTATGPQLDAELQNAITEFNYVKCVPKALAIAQSAGLPLPPQDRPGGHFAQLMEIIGLIALHDNPEAKCELAGAIRSSSSRGPGKERRFEGFPPSPPESVGSDEHETIRNNERQHQWAHSGDSFDENRRRQPLPQNRRTGQEMIRRDEPNMGTYATRLYEYCQQNGRGLDHEATQAGQTAAKWREVVNVDGRTFVGEANTKKAARHEAFRDACIELGI
ncbi:hypothetical protein BST61_g2442 [Cercospora zeina]